MTKKKDDKGTDEQAELEAKQKAEEEAKAKAEEEAKLKAENDEKEVTMTQSEFNATIKKRLDRQAKNQFGDYDQLKADSEELARLKKEQMTEAEKVQAERDELEAENKKKDQEISEKEQFFMDSAREREIKAQARAMGFKDPDYILFKLGEDESITVDEETYKVEGVDKALEALKKESPDLIDVKKSKIRPTNPGPGGDGEETDAQRHARIYGDNHDLFDPKSAEDHGGGVLFPGQGE